MTGRGRLYTLFRDELERQTGVLLAQLPALSTKEAVAAAKAATSSIIGAARVVGAGDVERLATALENAVTAVESGRLQVTEESEPVMLSAARMLRQLGAATQEEAETLLKERRPELASLSASLRSLLASAAKTAKGAPGKPEVAGSTRELFRVETEGNAATLSEGLLVLEREPQRLELIEKLMRSAHSIKGAARVIGLEPAVRLAHVMEDQLIRAQKRELGITPDAVELLLKGSDALLRFARTDEATPSERVEDAGEALALAARIEGLSEPPGAAPAATLPPAPVSSATLSSATLSPTASPATLSPAALSPAALSPAAAPAPSPAVAPVATAEADRVLRVRASHLSRLVSLAGESLVEARRLKPFADAQHRLRMRQASLADLVNDLHQMLGAPNVDDPVGVRIGELRERVDDCRTLVTEWVAEFEEHARRSEDLTIRLFREATESRMRPLGDGLAGFPRMVRDVSRKLGKAVDLVMTGATLGVDRDILEKLEAPLNHLLRNAVDHGLETPEERRRSGKPERGTLRLDARTRSGMLAINVTDDGRGVDVEKVREKGVRLGLVAAAEAAHLPESRVLDLLFAPGFSTREAVTEISGRGVGLDVVQSVLFEVGGSVHVTTEAGRGTTFHLTLPLSRSVIRAVIVEVAGEPYAFPLNRVERLARVPLSQVRVVEDRQYTMVDGASVALVPAAQVLELSGAPPASDPQPVVIVADRAQRVGFAVDRFAGELDLVVRPLSPRLGRVADIAAAAILPDGSPALIVDVEDLVRSVHRLQQVLRLDRIAPSSLPAPRTTKRVLVVDDSTTVRELERQLLQDHGYSVSTAVDGVDGWAAVRDTPFDLVITDVDMPRMDGLALTRSIKQDARLGNVPVLVVSYRETDEDRFRAEQAGADRYLTKGEFDSDALLRSVTELIGRATS